jgi:hypothetical protein
MAEKEQTNGYAPTEAEAEEAATHAREQRKKKRTKCLLYIVLFVIFQTAVILVFVMTIMKIRTPKFRVRSATFQSLNLGTPTSPSLTGRMTAELSVKNANFGRYKYQDTTVDFFYRGTPVGEAHVSQSRVGWRSTKKFEVGVDLSLGGAQTNAQLASDLRAGRMPLTSKARMTGRVELIFVIKKNRSTDMNCTLEVVAATRQLGDIVCK